VIERLRRLDQVAYVRYASVYRRFKTLEELVDEAKAVIDARHYDVPGQGKLFIEPPGKQAASSNGEEIDAAAPKKARHPKPPRPVPQPNG
jgi:hypothetical protein